ncbi:hypothetical protein Poli38472_000212 [Pythium oligandrum]|uniref:Uncharacterized protein n=1 Tax=Pythium oligandrum TaxID=41045 RepID=A0A8K1CCA1_PYTOL|nr:hypothetical protein Poli38472_000212 [Pythium oligandrum]|eukprot:TMW60170.1 hypothetical protein Poli38472_000212 [Pythium oligandrum]
MDKRRDGGTTSSTSASRMDLQSRAEMQLLQVLHQKKAKSASGYLREERQRVEEQEENQQKRLTTENMKQFRIGQGKNPAPPREEDEMIAAVRQLEHHITTRIKVPDTLTPEASEENQIERNAVQRRERHMAGLQLYTEQVKTISDDIEVALIQSADEIKDILARIDTQLHQAEQTFQDDALLLRAENAEIMQMWDDMLAICDGRTREINAFAVRLDQIEQTRIQRVGAGLTALTKTLMDTAHALPPEVERIIESEAFELNVVVVSNRKSYADLIARMATADVDVMVETRLKWEQGQEHWRQLRHQDAIQRFQDALNSTAFTNPDERQHVVVNIRAYQQQTHDEKRMHELKKLGAAGATLTSVMAQGVLDNLSTIQREEEEQNAAFFDELRLLHDGKVLEAQTLTEALRLEVHGFGALAPEGEISVSKDTLMELLSDESLEEFFRMAGGLRSELDQVVKRLEIQELVYQANVAPLRTSVDVLLSAVPLESVMESQGKGAERKATQTLLERMRKASKTELVQLLPSLQTPLAMLRNLSDMNDVFKAEVEDIGVQLRVLMQENEALFGEPGDTASTTSADSQHTAESSGRQTADKGKTSMGPPSSAFTGGSSSPTNRTMTLSGPGKGLSASSVSLLAASIDIQAIRKIQRRVGTLVYVTELPEAFRTHLRFIATQLALQVRANDVVDAVIARECHDLLSHREEESKTFLKEIGHRIETQSALLHDQSERIAKFFHTVALTMEQSEARVEYVNLSALDLLDALKDHDDERLASLEQAFAASCARLRHAPDDATLQLEFEACTDLLQQIETAYRLYHRQGALAASHHMIATEKQHERFLRELCELFGLSAPSLPTEPTSTPFDVDLFLSCQYIEDCVSPKPPAESEEPGTARSQQSSGEPSEQANYSADPKDKGDTTSKKRGKGKPEAAPAEVPKERFETDFGLVLAVESNVAALVERILTQKSKDDDEESPGSETADNGGNVAADASTLGETVESVEEAPEVIAARLARDERLRQVVQIVEESFLVLAIPSSFQQELVDGFRRVILTQFDRNFQKHTTGASDLNAERQRDCNLLLEERLRMHWPRKGRLDVQLYQPRIGELYTHRQRLDRHLRTMGKKAKTQQEAFEKEVHCLAAYIEEIRVKQLALQTQLPMQQSLAALQGVEVKSKKLLSEFRSESTEKLSKLRDLVTQDSTALTASAQDYLRVCGMQLFPDLTSVEVISGRDYHPEEVEGVGARLAELETQLRVFIDGRDPIVADLEEKQRTVLGAAQEFKTRYQNCLQSLSMKEGLGQKYGVPRRTAQERFRSETTRADEVSARIDVLLASLQSMIESQRAVKTIKGIPSTDLATQILHILLLLRAQLYHRGVYFGFLKNLSQLEPTGVRYESGGVAGRPVFSDQDVVHDELWIPEVPFLEYVQQVAAKCREDTRALYKQEGKLEELPSSGVPVALDEYLTAQAEKARAYMIQQELKYREQIDTFGELLALAPETALIDLLDRTKNRITSITGEVVESLEAKYTQWMELKNKYTVELRPELCSPNNATQLQALCGREQARAEETLSGLRQTRAQLLEMMIKASKEYELELLAMFKLFLVILDSSVMTLEDLKPFTGEELPKLKRKTLKRLRKLARIQEFGDPREVKRSDEEMKKLIQLGEVPRFTKRGWPAIPSFGVHQLWSTKITELLSDDEAMACTSVDTALSELLNVSPTTTEDGSSVALLTHAHRGLFHGRDETYAEFCEFCKTHSDKLLVTLQEQVRDEVKWTESWQLGIHKVRRRAQPPSTEGS